MKKLILDIAAGLLVAAAFVFMFLLSGCGPSKQEGERMSRLQKKKTEPTATGIPEGFSVIRIDGCEYIYCEVARYRMSAIQLVHKANCKNHEAEVR